MNLKLTRERTLLGGLMLAAAVGLLADRFVFAGAAEEPSAIEVEADLAISTEPASPTRPLTSAATQSPEAMLATRLIELAGPDMLEASDVRDLFARAGSTRGSNIAAGEPGGAWYRRTLTAVMLRADGNSIAVVDGKLVRLGAWLDGFQLVRITQQTAVFSDGTTQITLRPGNPSAMN